MLQSLGKVMPPPLGLPKDGSWVLSTFGKITVAAEDEKLA